MTKPDNELGRAYGRFVELGRGLAATGHYEAAYHALMGAVHCAEDSGDVAQLAEVAELLREHKGAIDALDPPHKLSTRSAHGGRSIFEMGAVTAEAVIQRLANQRRIDAIRHPA